MRGLPGQKIKNGEHGPARAMRKIFDPPIAVTATIKWINDGEEIINTVAVTRKRRLPRLAAPEAVASGATWRGITGAWKSC